MDPFMQGLTCSVDAHHLFNTSKGFYDLTLFYVSSCRIHESRLVSMVTVPFFPASTIPKHTMLPFPSQR